MGSEQFLQIGTLIAGRYEVMKCLGAGSMGLVYACRDLELSGRIVAVKVLFPEINQDKVAAQRFRNEVFASYDVSHPNVVRAYEFIRDGDMVAYTMEYVNGGDLASRLASQKTIPIPEVINILSQMCLGVQAIHDAQIIHRDLKPENIMLTKDGIVKIADFGIARVGHGSKLTEHGGVVGTIDYVSPEYMLNSQVDWRSDIYAMGILAYEMLAGVTPFRGDSIYATMSKRLKSDPEPISKNRPDCPPELEKIVFRAMARDPEKRFQSAYEMFEELQKIGGDAALYAHQGVRSNNNSHNNGIENIVEYVGRVSEDEKIKDNQVISVRKDSGPRAKNNTYSLFEEKTVSDQLIPRGTYHGSGSIDQMEEVIISDLYQNSDSMGSIESFDGTFMEDESKTTTASSTNLNVFDFYENGSGTPQSSISLEEVQKNITEQDKEKKGDFKILSYKVLSLIVFVLIFLGLIYLGISLAENKHVDDAADFSFETEEGEY